MNYLKEFSNDYQVGGVYHSLSLTAFKAIVCFQANANNQGVLMSLAGRPYRLIELCGICQLDYRSMKRAIVELETKGIINYDANKHIVINSPVREPRVIMQGNNKYLVRCFKCGYEWASRNPYPVRCALCNNPNPSAPRTYKQY